MRTGFASGQRRDGDAHRGQHGRAPIMASCTRAVVGVLAPVVIGAALMPTPALAGSMAVSSMDRRDSSGAVQRYLVEVTGTPVAVLAAGQDVAGHRSARVDAQVLRASALREVAPIEQAVEELGGSVHDRYVDAIRALSITLPSDAVPALRAVEGVVAVEPVRALRRSSDHVDVTILSPTRAFGTAPAPWARRGLTGRGVKIAILDTGIDYTHADFGGRGTKESFTGNDGAVIEPGTFPTAKVVAGYDFVGDAYDSVSSEPGARIPVPDPDPLDCEGHGTHVAGTAAGLGVTADGRTYTGPYDAAAMSTLTIAPGTAPQAELMAYRVFGCEGDNDSQVVVAAIDRAVKDGADVINMSMGRPYGTSDHMEARAADNAVRAGVVVIASAGNSGNEPYLVSAPSTGTRVLSIAALDDVLDLPGGVLDPADSAAADVHLNLTNDVPPPVSGAVRVLRDARGEVRLGCQASDYAGSEGAIVVVARGVCPRVDRPALGQAAGARAVIMINDAATGRPPIEGSIPGVTIPFLGAAKSDTGALLAVDGLPRTIRASRIANDSAREPTSFTSSGPRTGDSGVKPDLAAPGASITSAASGGGTAGRLLSGTSMAAPFVAGVAAVVRQAHPDWSSEAVSAAIAGTASVQPSALATMNRQRVGTGVIAPMAALRAPVLLIGPSGSYGLSFGVHELTSAGAERRVTRAVRVRNPSDATIRVRLTVKANGPTFAAFSISQPMVTVPPGEERAVEVTMTMPRSAHADPDGALPLASATVIASVDGASPVRMLAQGLVLDRSLISARSRPDGAIALTNSGRFAGSVQMFTWLLADDLDPAMSADLRAIGFSTELAGDRSAVPEDRIVTFAINQGNRFSNPARARYTVKVDANRDGTWDHSVFGVDEGFFETGNDEQARSNGVFSVQAVDLTPDPSSPVAPVVGQAQAPMNGSTVLLSVPASAIGLSAANPRARVAVESVSFNDPVLIPDTTSTVEVNAWDADTAGSPVDVAPGQRVLVPTIAGRHAGQPSALGTMVVALDNPAGRSQAILIRRRS